MKLLIIAPHLSTGGLPQYLVAQIERQIKSLDLYVVEYDFCAPEYVVQRNKVLRMLGPARFATVGPSKTDLLRIIIEQAPDVIHWAEIPELFCDREVAATIYGEGRPWRIVETTHTCGFDPRHKVFIPDKFVFVTPFSVKQYAEAGLGYVPAVVLEYPITPKARPDRTKALAEFGLDPGAAHVLNVGLFTQGKNQGEAFALAGMLTEKKVQFHFVGNRAENFREYWQHLVPPMNCRLWGERADVNRFYAACDLFLFTSRYELNPLVLKEAMAWGMPVLMRDLPTYEGRYKENPEVCFLTDDQVTNASMITQMLWI